MSFVVNTRNLYWLALVVVVIAYLAVLWVDRSRVGHVAAATRENELRVRALGLQPYHAKLLVFVVGGLVVAQGDPPEAAAVRAGLQDRAVEVAVAVHVDALVVDLVGVPVEHHVHGRAGAGHQIAGFHTE